MSDAQDDDRLMNLVGDLNMAAERCLKAGGDVADVVTCLGQVLGEFLAEHHPHSTSPAVAAPVVLRTAMRAYDLRMRVNAERAAARAQPMEQNVFGPSRRRRR